MAQDRSAQRVTVLAKCESCDVQVLERSGPYIRLLSVQRLEAGLALQWQEEGEMLLGRVIDCRRSGSGFEIWLETRQSPAPQDPAPPAWRSAGPASLMGDLLKLNAQLLAFSPSGKGVHRNDNPQGTVGA